MSSSPIAMSMMAKDEDVIDGLYKEEGAVPLFKITDRDHKVMRDMKNYVPENLFVKAVVIGIIYTKTFYA